tara:strand:+ start:468 stop:743 length:276 start_codon:yes stop_codon:yes gene_type:complete
MIWNSGMWREALGTTSYSVAADDEDMVQATPTATSFEAAAVWNYEHNLGRFPIIQILDVDGNLISPSIQHISVNHVRITNGSDKSGTLILY